MILALIPVIGIFKEHQHSLFGIEDLNIHGGLGSDIGKIDIDIFHIKRHLVGTVPVILLIYEDEMIKAYDKRLEEFKDEKRNLD